MRIWPLGLLLCAAAAADGPPRKPPRLPAPRGKVVQVNSEAQLQRAVRRLESGTTILIAPGKYRLTSTVHIRGGVERVSLRGATGRPQDVELIGPGMRLKAGRKNVPHGVMVSDAKDVLIADLTIRDVYYHPITLQGPAGCQRPRVYNCRLIDAGEQFVKANPGVDGGIVEYTVMAYTRTCRDDYTNGVDVHKGKGWIIRHCLFRNIRAPKGGKLAGPAVLMWRGCRDTICESNLFLNCERGIAYGLSNSAALDHRGGIIRNNIFHRSKGQTGDAGIMVFNSPGTRVLHNTVVLSGTYPNAIEYRFARTTGVEISRNLTDAAISKRNGASGVVRDNLTRLSAAWFVDFARGDLHLERAARAAIDRLPPHKLVPRDFDGARRGRRVDLGADEFGKK